MLKAGLLSVSMLIGVQMSISPAIPAMRDFFSDLPHEAVESITTVQNFSGFVFILACPWVAGRLGKKRTVFLALLVAADRLPRGALRAARRRGSAVANGATHPKSLVRVTERQAPCKNRDGRACILGIVREYDARIERRRK